MDFIRFLHRRSRAPRSKGLVRRDPLRAMAVSDTRSITSSCYRVAAV
jgi:hypothetical protein